MSSSPILASTVATAGPVINLEVPNLNISHAPETASCVTYGLTGQKVTSRRKKLAERKVSWREHKGKISSAPTPREMSTFRDNMEDSNTSASPTTTATNNSTGGGPLRRYNLKVQRKTPRPPNAPHSSTTPRRNQGTSTHSGPDNKSPGSTLLSKPPGTSPVPEIDIPKASHQGPDANLKPIFVPIAWSMPYKPPLADPGVISLYPRDILHFRQGPEKTLNEIRASQSVLAGSFKKSVFSTAQPPPVTPASRQITNIS